MDFQWCTYNHRIVNTAQAGNNSTEYYPDCESCKSTHDLKNEFIMPSEVELEKIISTVSELKIFKTYNKFIEDKGFRAYNKGLFCGYPKKNTGVSTNRNFVLSIPYISNTNDGIMLIVFSDIDGLSKSFIVSLENLSKPNLVIYKENKNGTINVEFEGPTTDYFSGDASINSADWQCYSQCLLDSLWQCAPFSFYPPLYAACVAGLTAFCCVLCDIIV